MKKFGRFTLEEAREKVQTLPMWAQDYIQYLERERAGLERQVETFAEEQTPSDISWQQMMENEHWVPRHSHVRFYIDNSQDGTRGFGDGHIDVFFRNEGERKVLEIQGSRSYTIEPRAGNSIYIVMRTREEYYGKREKCDEEVSKL